MASQSALSTLNRVRAATLTASTGASGFPVEHLAEPEHLGLRWRSTATTESWIVVDLGSAIPVDRVSLIGANFASVVLQQHTSDTWGAPAYTSGTLTIGLDPDRDLYRLSMLSPANFTRRFTRVLIPAQTPVDGAAYFELGGLHLGSFTPLPRGCSPGYGRGRIRPRMEQTAALGGWRVTYATGDPSAIHRWRRQAEKNPLSPGVGDEWQDWLTIDRLIERAPQGGLFCAVVGNWNQGATAALTSSVYMMRQGNETDWADEQLVAERDAWDLVEATAG
jgi:hypothetical protein